MDLSSARVVATALAVTGGLVLAVPDSPGAPSATGERGVMTLLAVDPPSAPVAAPPPRPAAPSRTSVAPPRRLAAATPRVRVVPRAVRPARAAALPSWQQRRGEAALELIGYRWPDLGWQITFHPAQRGVLGIASRNDKRIRVYVRRDQPIRVLAFSTAHEIGHALDFTTGTPESRARWLELRRIDPDTPWFGCEACADLETPAGDFAEVFAAWQVGFVDFRSRMAPAPTADDMRLLEQHFAELTAQVSA